MTDSVKLILAALIVLMVIVVTYPRAPPSTVDKLEPTRHINYDVWPNVGPVTDYTGPILASSNELKPTDCSQPMYSTAEADRMITDARDNTRNAMKSSIVLRQQPKDWVYGEGNDIESVYDDTLPYKWQLPSLPVSLYAVTDARQDSYSEDGPRLPAGKKPTLVALPDAEPYVGASVY